MNELNKGYSCSNEMKRQMKREQRQECMHHTMLGHRAGMHNAVVSLVCMLPGQP